MLPTPAPILPPHTLTLLLTYLNGRPLFPGLRKVSITHHGLDGSGVGYFPLVIVPSIQEVEFFESWVLEHVFADYCLALVREHKACIRRLSIVGGDGIMEQHAITRILEVTSQMTQLEALKIQVQTTEQLQPVILSKTFDRLINLREVEYKVSCKNHSRHQPYSSSVSPELPLLSRIVLDICSSSYICSCVPRFLLSRASVIRLPYWPSDPSPEPFVEIVDGRSVAPSPVDIDVSARLIAEPSTILPIFTSLRVRHFSLRVAQLRTPFFELTDTIIRGASKQHPSELVELTLIDPTASNGATLESLAAIAAGLPDLETLTITLGQHFQFSAPLGLTANKWLDHLRQGPSSCSKLRTLVISREPARSPLHFRDVNTLAQILDLLFPSLEYIKPSNDFRASLWGRVWGPVEQQRQMYQGIRILSSSKP